MKKQLTTLIKLAKNETDKVQKQLAQIVTRQDGFIEQKKKLEVELETEMQKADEFPETAKDFAEFARAMRDRIAKYIQEIARLQEKIDIKQEELRDAFANQKKYEIALENKLEELKIEEKKEEQKKLDEIAGRKKPI